MIILFNGAFSIHSAGDDATLSGILELLRRELGADAFEARVLCRHPDTDFEQAFGVYALPNLEYPTKEASQGRWLRGFNPDDSPDILLKMIELYRSADLVILGGGNFLNENSFGLFRGMLPRLCVNLLAARLTGTPCLLLALSASPLHSPLAREMATWLLANASAVTFRDRASVEVLQNCGIVLPTGAEILPDPVLAAPSASMDRVTQVLAAEGVPTRIPGKPRLAVSLREFVHRGEDVHRAYLARMRGVIRGWRDGGGDVLLIPQCTYEHGGPHADDRNVAAEMLDGIDDRSGIHSIRAHHWPGEIEGLYSACDVALCTRLHAGVFACKQSVPAVALGYEAKVEGFWRDIGLPDYCIPIDSTAEEIVDRLKSAMQSFPVAALQSTIAARRRAAKRYAEWCRELLSDRRQTKV